MDVVETTDIERRQATMKSASERTDAPEGYVDWRRQAAETVWLLASDNEQEVGAGIALTGWYSPPHVARADVCVPPPHRGRGIGLEFYRALSGWARERRTASPGRRGRDSTTSAARHASPSTSHRSRGPTRIRRPTSRSRRGPRVRRPPVEEWLSRDMQGVGDKPEATFVALAGDRVVGYAKLALSLSRPEVVMHDLTAVLRTHRRRGIAAALKRTQIAWAQQAGYARLETSNEVRNEPIRRLNERYGYRVEPGKITLLGPLATG